MTVEQFKDIIRYNEPEFLYKGTVYSICHPCEIFYVYSEKHPEYLDLAFSSIDDLLNNWMIDGKPFRELLPDTIWEW